MLLQPKLVGSLTKHVKALDRAMIYSSFKDKMLRFDGSNFTGVFRFQHGSNKKLFYCITNKGEQIAKPITSPLWEKQIRYFEQGLNCSNRQTMEGEINTIGEEDGHGMPAVEELLAEPTGKRNIASDYETDCTGAKQRTTSANTV
jgi:hypothetical protein